MVFGALITEHNSPHSRSAANCNHHYSIILLLNCFIYFWELWPKNSAQTLCELCDSKNIPRERKISLLVTLITVLWKVVNDGSVECFRIGNEITNSTREYARRKKDKQKSVTTLVYGRVCLRGWNSCRVNSLNHPVQLLSPSHHCHPYSATGQLLL